MSYKQIARWTGAVESAAIARGPGRSNLNEASHFQIGDLASLSTALLASGRATMEEV